MPLAPFDWNVVIPGYWNRGILTPGGIAVRLFQINQESPFEIQVPVDALGPFKVGVRGVRVAVEAARLTVETVEANYPSLQTALQIAHQAATSLPETPISAAGYNIRYQGSTADQQLAPLVNALEHPVDNAIARLYGRVMLRGLVRSFPWDGGKIRLGVTREENDVVKIEVNFDRQGTRDEMVAWLQRPSADIEGRMRTVLFDVLALPQGVMG